MSPLKTPVRDCANWCDAAPDTGRLFVNGCLPLCCYKLKMRSIIALTSETEISPSPFTSAR